MGTAMEPDSGVGRKEFDEFKARLEDQKKRWDRRLDILEKKSDENNKLTTSVAELAQSVKTLTVEMERHGRRLDTIEKRDGEMWRKFIGYVMTALITAIVTYFFARFGR